MVVRIPMTPKSIKVLQESYSNYNRRIMTAKKGEKKDADKK